MHVAIATVCESLVEAEGGRRDVIGPLFRVRFDVLPSGIPEHVVLFRLLGEPGDDDQPHPRAVKLVAPDGRVLLEHAAGDVSTANPTPEMTSIDFITRCNAGSTTLDTIGTYRWELLAGGERVAAAMFTVARKTARPTN
jgi:hypothetical protein